jgi:hypothetical protein
VPGVQVVKALVSEKADKRPLLHWYFAKQEAVAFLMPDTDSAVHAL